MAHTTLDIDDPPEPQDDSGFIDGIFNYCDRWCERCAFTDRCRLFFDSREQKEKHPDRSLVEDLEDSFTRMFSLLNAWCAQHGIDFDKVQREADSAAVDEELRRMDDTRSDPLQKAADAYSTAAYKILQAMEHAALFETLPDPVRDAIDTITAYTLYISSKIHRALSGYAVRDDEIDDSPIQNDWNGSAKVARLIVAESKHAWERLIEAGHAPADAPVRRMPALLDRIDRELADRFPHAMQFIRPGFDQAPSAGN